MKIHDVVPRNRLFDDNLDEAHCFYIYDTRAQDDFGFNKLRPRPSESIKVDIRWQAVDILGNVGSWTLGGKCDETLLERGAWIDVLD
jgi:hypothetical protein